MSVIRKCERVAAKILSLAEIDSVPVNLEQVAYFLRIDLKPIFLGDDVSGMLVMDGSKARIGYNANHPVVRRRFTIAHEIGHFVLHHHIQKLFIDKKHPVVYRRKRPQRIYDRREVEANAFAAALLMPAKRVEEAARLSGFDLADDSSLSSLAKDFNVSQASMTYRLANLQLFADFKADSERKK